MISFANDYSEGCSPEILEALNKTNYIQTGNYGLDEYSLKAEKLIKKTINNNKCDVHFIPGGTPCNILGIAACLNAYEAVIACKTGHINVHETGAIEATGHKIIQVKGKEGKISPQEIEEVCINHCDEHMVKPRMVFISNSTELGTIYSLNELKELKKVCDKYHLYLYMDGARLGSALTAKENDVSFTDLPKLLDMFYIGGTKNGALLGEAMVIVNPKLKENFRFLLKQKGAMLAKGRTIGLSFICLFTDDLYLKNAKHANEMAEIISSTLKKSKYKLYQPTCTNQIFVILSNKTIKKLQEKFVLTIWGKYDENNTIVRIVTSWATKEDDVNKLSESLTALALKK